MDTLQNAQKKQSTTESHVRIIEHLEAAGGAMSDNPWTEAVGILRLTVMHSIETKGYVGQHQVADAWTLVLTIAGGGRIDCSGQRWQAGVGTLYAIPPDIRFIERQVGSENWRYICLQVTARAERARWLDWLGNKVRHRPVRPEFVALMHHAVDVLHRRPTGFELTATGLCLAIFGELQGESNERSGHQQILVERAERYIAASLACPPTVADLAARCQVSPSTLAHSFKAQTGYSVHDYILRKRVQRAKILMLSGARIGETADRLGFGSQFHFSRVFRQYEGVSPRQFLRISARKNLS
jgi:AraC family transcriptional regulator of arabinose operon